MLPEEKFSCVVRQRDPLPGHLIQGFTFHRGVELWKILWAITYYVAGLVGLVPSSSSFLSSTLKCTVVGLGTGLVRKSWDTVFLTAWEFRLVFNLSPWNTLWRCLSTYLLVCLLACLSVCSVLKPPVAQWADQCPCWTSSARCTRHLAQAAAASGQEVDGHNDQDGYDDQDGDDNQDGHDD